MYQEVLLRWTQAILQTDGHYKSLNFFALSPKSTVLSAAGTMWPKVVRPVITGVELESICSANLSNFVINR